LKSIIHHTADSGITTTKYGPVLSYNNLQQRSPDLIQFRLIKDIILPDKISRGRNNLW